MPLLWISLALLLGILLAGAFGAAWGLGLAAFTALLLLGAAYLERRRPGTLPAAWPLPAPLLAAALVLGALRFVWALPDRSDPARLAFYNDREADAVLEGVVVQPPRRLDAYSELRVRVDTWLDPQTEQGQAVTGLLLVRLPRETDWRYGDRLRLEGALQTPPEHETFSYREYLARQGVLSWMPRARAELLAGGQGNGLLGRLYALRSRSKETLHRLFPDPEAAFLAGVLLGDEDGIPDDVERAFQDTGAAHVIAISGFNITILAAMFSWLFSRLLGRWKGLLVSALLIALYTLLVGAGPAVVRAAILGVLALGARQVGRRQVGVNSLAVAAALMALWNPNVLWDVGFQLSFAATLGLVLYAPPLEAGFKRLAARWLPAPAVQRLAGPAGEYLLYTLAAQVMILPVTVYHFQRLPLVSLLVNPAILPAQPPVMLAGGLALLLGLASHSLGQLAAWLAWPFAAYTIRAVEWFQRWPGGVLVFGQTALGWVGLYYFLLLGGTVFGGRLRLWLEARWGLVVNRLSALAGAALVGLALLNGVVWQAALRCPDGRLHLTVLSVGSGDALLIEAPGGARVLVDGGPSATRLSDGLGRRLPLLDRRLAAWVVANPGQDNLAALPDLLERYPPGQVLWAGETSGTAAGRRLVRELSRLNVPVVNLESGQTLDLGDGAVLRVLSAGRRGAVLLLEWERFRLLLPLGVDFESLPLLLEDPALKDVTAVLLAESGYAPANPPELMAHLNPRLALISVAAGDWQGLPSEETLQTLEGRTALRTDQVGWIELSTDGVQMWVEVEDSTGR